MSTHTPGPWRVRGGASGVFSHDIVGPNGEDVGYVNQSDGADDPALYQLEANARLIAAAPELLAALKLARLWLANCIPVVEPDGPKPLPVIEAAIAKAEAAS